MSGFEALLPFIPGMIQAGGSILGGRRANRGIREADKYLSEIPGFGREAYQPFIEQGRRAESELYPQYSQMAANPQSTYNDILSGYQESPGYKYQLQKLMEQAHNTAAQGGYAGTGGDIQQRSELMQALLGQDMQQFLENILGIGREGRAGLEGRAGRGFQASGNLADYLGTANMMRGGLAHSRGQQGAANRESALSSLASLAGMFNLSPEERSMSAKYNAPSGQWLALNQLNRGG